MLKSKDELKENLEEVIKFIKHDKQTVESIKDSLMKKGILRGQVQKILIGETALSSLDLKVLCLLNIVIYDETQILNINPYKYFSIKEIDSARNIRLKIKDETMYFPLSFNNVIKVADREFSAVIESPLLLRLYNSNIFKYNYDVQKHYKLKRSISSSVIKSINIDHDYINEVSQKIIENKFSIEPIMLSVLDEYGNELSYNHLTLNISKSDIYIVSGFHDINALINATEINPELSINIQVDIKYQTQQEFKDFVNILNLKGGVN